MNADKIITELLGAPMYCLGRKYTVKKYTVMRDLGDLHAEYIGYIEYVFESQKVTVIRFEDKTNTVYAPDRISNYVPIRTECSDDDVEEVLSKIELENNITIL